MPNSNRNRILQMPKIQSHAKKLSKQTTDQICPNFFLKIGLKIGPKKVQKIYVFGGQIFIIAHKQHWTHPVKLS